MGFAFAILAALTLGSAAAAMSLRNLVHCALCLAVTFAGLAALYLGLGAEFVGLAQLLIYVGAVAILVVMAILLTRSAGAETKPFFSSSWRVGLAVVGLVGGVFVFSVISSRALPLLVSRAPELTVRQIGDQLMTRYVLPLEAVALLFTAAMIGAVIIARHERRTK